MLIAVCSVKSSPGATTLATALAARWPADQSPILVEADPSGGDLAARLRLGPPRGLVAVAAASRWRRDPGMLAEHAHRLPGGLAVVAAPIGPEQASAAIAAIAVADGPLRRAADAARVAVIVDCGRVDPGSPALPILAGADAMLLLTGAGDDDLAHIAQRLPEATGWSRRPCLVVAGDGRSTAEVSAALGVAVLARIPHDPKGAAALRGHPHGHGPDRSKIGRAAQRIAKLLAGETDIWQPPTIAASPVDISVRQSAAALVNGVSS